MIQQLNTLIEVQATQVSELKEKIICYQGILNITTRKE